MESANVVVYDQGTVSTSPWSSGSETEGSLHRSTNDASTNTEDASPFVESLSQPKDLTISFVGSNRETSRQVQKDHSTTDIIGDPKARSSNERQA